MQDGSDAFPSDPNEHTDTDGDGTGDNADGAPNDPNSTTAPASTPSQYPDIESSVQGSQNAPIILEVSQVDTEDGFSGNTVPGIRFVVLDTRSFTSQLHSIKYLLLVVRRAPITEWVVLMAKGTSPLRGRQHTRQVD